MSADFLNCRLCRIQTSLRIGMEADMNTNSPESRALIWTGSIIGVIVVLTLIAFYGGMIPQ